MPLEQAARKDDPVATSGERRGMYAGAVVGGMVGAGIGSLGGGVGAVPGAGIGIGLGSDAGKLLGAFGPDSPGSPGDILAGSSNVHTNQRPQARVDDPTKKGPIKQGSLSVGVNGKPAARRGDQTESGNIERGSSNVWIGGPSADVESRGDNIGALEQFVLGVLGDSLSNLAKMALRQAVRRAVVKNARDAILDAYEAYLNAHGMEAQAEVLHRARGAQKAREQREDLASLRPRRPR